MKTFATLIHALESTNKTNRKIEALIQYLDQAAEKDKLWLLALFTGKKPKRSVNTTMMKYWALEVTGLPEWLFVECYSAVGDLGETLALILPPTEHTIEKSLSQWIEEIAALKDREESDKKAYVLNAWENLGNTERFIFNKLLGGSFRLGISSKSMINALAKYYNLEPSAVTHSIMGEWNVENVTFEGLIRGEFTDVNSSKPYPFSLAYPLEETVSDLGAIDEWQAEYKWDGIRGQIIKRNDEVFIWSRGEELITHQFPEVVEAVEKVAGDFVIDGELLAYKDSEVLNFSELQKRLNRKSITKKLMEETPVAFFAYDIMEIDLTDLRSQPLKVRRTKLENLLKANDGKTLQLPEIIDFRNWDDLSRIRSMSRELNSEGLMLKHKESIYHTGRKKGDWWKWKLDPLTIDAVLIYAQKGSGRRSGYYTDYTFAVKKDDQLVTIAKAYSGLTDKEIQEVSKFVNKNAIEKFGPVRTVKPELVFEIAFEGIGFSSRHKSGVALRFPRIARWRKDKKVSEIDDIETIKLLIT